MPVNDKAVDAAKTAYAEIAATPPGIPANHDGALRAALEAALAHGEPVVWAKTNDDGRLTEATDKPFLAQTWIEDGYHVRTLYAHPAPQPSGAVQVKPLEWHGKGWPRAAPSIVGMYKIWAGNDVWLDGECLNEMDRHPDYTEDEAKAAALADYERRVLSAIAQAPAPIVADGWQSSESIPTDEGVIIEVQIRERPERWNAGRFAKFFDGDTREVVWRYPDAPHPASKADELAAARAEIERLRGRYENWKPITTPPHEAENPSSLLCFWCEPSDEDEGYWSTGVWDERPDSAVMWCSVNTPAGPHSEHFAALKTNAKAEERS
ncbi:hypothetical protein [Phyllobacterium leguminum]|uniref:DUF551 domain-containing protein n=1 Tax=Phyllobacterium leguminum TaxID=314237 RepID=A0A318TK30_9HYPH|nr:hypothetical protein [Phyllobacterium leguminum]PYE89650.1 hypothetical protein C7477_103158 [Phyllobacterium leguminum]